MRKYFALELFSFKGLTRNSNERHGLPGGAFRAAMIFGNSFPKPPWLEIEKFAKNAIFKKNGNDHEESVVNKKQNTSSSLLSVPWPTISPACLGPQSKSKMKAGLNNVFWCINTAYRQSQQAQKKQQKLTTFSPTN